MAKISKYTFEEVENKLDVIKTDQGKDKCLLGDGTYGNLPTGEDDDTYNKFVVVCIAGQSNAVGYDESPVDTNFTYVNRNTNRIKQLGFYGEDNLKVIDLGYCAQSMQDMTAHNRPGTETAGTKGIHLPLANLMLDYIPDDYGVLMLPISFGGTGFTSGNTGTYSSELKKPTDTGAGQGTAILKWGVGTAYYNTLKDRIIHALELNEENLFAGIVWCQGENDKTNASGHYSAFQEMTNALFTALNDAGLGGRVPKGTWDKDIWYNMETVGYWYSQGQCQQIWDNYKEWNENTYVEIPRDTESNEVNGTGQTTQNYPSHYGNNAYQKVVAPRVLQKMIDMNTFGKKVNVVEPEVEIPESEGGASYPVVTEGTRVATQSDITTKSSLMLVIDENGTCISTESLKGKFQNNSVEQPCVYFGDIYKMEWTVARNMYWMIVEGDIAGDFALLGLGGGNTRQFATITNNSLTVIENGKSLYPNDQYDFVVGDKIRVYRNADNSLSVYRTNNANGVFQKWFDHADKGKFEVKGLGFGVGIAGAEFNSPFNLDEQTVFEGMKIQKQEPFPNAQINDLELEKLQRFVESSDSILVSTIDEMSNKVLEVESANAQTSGMVRFTKTDIITNQGSSLLRKGSSVYLSLKFSIANELTKENAEATGAVGSVSINAEQNWKRVLTSLDHKHFVTVRCETNKLYLDVVDTIPAGTAFEDIIYYTTAT